MEAPRCTRCGQVQSVQSEFCFRCGNRIFEGTPAEPPQPARTGPLPRDTDEAFSLEDGLGARETGAPLPPAAEPRRDMVEVTVPDWLVADWAAPVALAVSATLFGLIANYLLEIFIVLSSVIGTDSVAWGDAAGQPLVLWAGFHGAIRGFSLSVTGFAWILFASIVGLRFARSLVPGVSVVASSDRATIVARAVKAGVVTVGIIIVISRVAAALVDPLEPGSFFFGDRAFFGSANTFGAIFIGFSAGALGALIALAREGGLTLETLTGVRLDRQPALLGPAWAGAKRTLLIGVVGMAVFFYVAQIVDVAGFESGPGGRDVFALALAFIPWILFWGLLDIGGIMLLNAMRFFISEPDVLLTGRPGWVYFGVVIAAAAFFLGGLAAARARRANDGPTALKTAVSPALIVTPVLFVASWFWASSEGGEIVGSAVLLPLLWTVVLAGGGLYWANQAGLSPAISVRTSSAASRARPPATPPLAAAPSPGGPAQTSSAGAPASAVAYCSRCGAAVSADARFCSRCGAPVNP